MLAIKIFIRNQLQQSK